MFRSEREVEGRRAVNTGTVDPARTFMTSFKQNVVLGGDGIVIAGTQVPRVHTVLDHGPGNCFSSVTQASECSRSVISLQYYFVL